MPHDPKSSQYSLIPPKPVPEAAEAFSKQVHSLLDGKPKDEATVAHALEGMDEMLDAIAAGMYNLASMLVGEGEHSIRLVETAVARAEISSTANVLEGRQSSRRALCSAAIEVLAEREPDSLAAPEELQPVSTCIEDDDLSAAGLSTEELERMLSGPDRDSVRKWLASLPTEMRTIFVLRAVAGFSAGETAALLAKHGGATASGWTAEAVRAVFRQGLCSLASQLIHATAPR